MPLTDIQARKAKPREKRYALGDGDGLYLLVWPSGTKTWSLRLWHNNKDQWIALGRYPSISLAEARAKRESLKANPSLRPALHTFRAVALEWVDKQSALWVPAHTRSVHQKLEKWLFPRIGDRPLREISAPELLAALQAIEGQGLIETARRTRQIFSLVARYGVAIGACEFDVSSALVGALKPHKVKPMAALTKVEDIRRLLQAMKEYKGGLVVRTALWFSLYTLARPGEVCHAEWGEIDLEKATWSIPAEKMKRRKPHVVPLCRQAVELLEALRQKTGHGRYVFPSAHSPDGSRPMSGNAVRLAIRKMGFSSGEMTAHGFRSLGSTRLNEMGFRPDVIEAALAHTRGGVRGIYNRADYWEERVAMMEKWGEWVLNIIIDN